jgi:hypothetical protein
VLSPRIIFLCQENAMVCPSCGVGVLPCFNLSFIHSDAIFAWQVRFMDCPECGHLIVRLEKAVIDFSFPMGEPVFTATIGRPGDGRSRKAGPGVPRLLAQDFEMAALVLPYSARTSAAMSRRCLQLLLCEKATRLEKDIEAEMTILMQQGYSPERLLQNVALIGTRGGAPSNSAPSNSGPPTSGQQVSRMLPTAGFSLSDMEGARSLLDILATLFDFFYRLPVGAIEKGSPLQAHAGL